VVELTGRGKGFQQKETGAQKGTERAVGRRSKKKKGERRYKQVNMSTNFKNVSQGGKKGKLASWRT